MRTLSALTTLGLTLSAVVAQQETEPAPVPAPQAQCPLCQVPNRAALLAGLVAQTCPAGCTQLCCTGTEATYLVEGLVCEQCTSKVTAALAKLDGIHVDAVCLNTGQARVRYDPKRLGDKQIMAAITAAGHKVTGRKLSFPVTGLADEDHARNLRDRLIRIPGAQAVHATAGEVGTVIVVHDPALSGRADFEEVIREAGYPLAAAD